MIKFVLALILFSLNLPVTLFSAELNAVLIDQSNSRSALSCTHSNFDQLVQNFGHSTAVRLQGESELCRDLGACWLPLYLEKTPIVLSSPTQFGLLFRDECQGADNWLQSEEQCQVSGLITKISDFDSVSSEYDFTELLKSCSGLNKKQSIKKYNEWFKENKFLTVQGRVKLESKDTKKLLDDSQNGKIEGSIVQNAFLNSPNNGTELLRSYKYALTKGDKIQSALLEQSLFNNLILTLNAWIPSADYRRSTYPYIDSLVILDNMLQVDHLYAALKKIGKWPKLVSLTPELRTKWGGSLLKKNSKNRYLVKGFYNSTENSLVIDITESYSDALFTLYHELVHVYQNHSIKQSVQIEKYRDLIQKNNTGQIDLNQFSQEFAKTLKTELSYKELQSIHQQTMLYHAVGEYIENPNGPAPSTQKWHDVNYGHNFDFRSFSRALRRERAITRTSGSSLGGMFRSMLAAPFNAAVLGVNGAYVQSLDLDSDFFRKQAEIHLNHFDKVYLNSGFDINDYTLRHQQYNSAFDYTAIKNPDFLEMSCKQAISVFSQVKLFWTHGLPINYKIIDKCDFKNGPGNIGNDGSHFGNDGSHFGNDGSHFELNGFPSLDADGKSK